MTKNINKTIRFLLFGDTSFQNSYLKRHNRFAKLWIQYALWCTVQHANQCLPIIWQKKIPKKRFSWDIKCMQSRSVVEVLTYVFSTTLEWYSRELFRLNTPPYPIMLFSNVYQYSVNFSDRMHKKWYLYVWHDLLQYVQNCGQFSWLKKSFRQRRHRWTSLALNHFSYIWLHLCYLNYATYEVHHCWKCFWNRSNYIEHSNVELRWSIANSTTSNA